MSDEIKPLPVPWYSRHRTLRYRSVQFISKLSKGRIRSPLYHSSVAFHAASDVKTRDDERVPGNEHVKVWCLWTVEFFTPDNIASLYSALDNLVPVANSHDRKPGDYLRSMRNNPGSSMELYLTPKGGRAWGIGHYCDLPKFSSHAQGSIICVTPSLTLLVMNFELVDVERERLDHDLHVEYSTRITQNPGGSVSTSSPELERRRIVQESRDALVGQATAWHRTHFPGLLCTNDELVPACEFNVIEGASPLSRSNSNLLSALGLDWSHGIFEGPVSDQPIQIHLSRQIVGDFDNQTVLLSTTLTELQSVQAAGYGSDDRGKVAWIDTMFRRTFAAASLPRVIQFYSERTARARDNASAVVGSGKAVEALARVRADTAQCIDASLVARELRTAAQRGELPVGDLDLTMRNDWDETIPSSLAEATKNDIERLADDLMINVEALNTGLNAQANLLSAHANLKLQPWIIFLAIASLIASIVAAVGPFRELMHWDNATKVEAARPARNK